MWWTMRIANARWVGLAAVLALPALAPAAVPDKDAIVAKLTAAIDRRLADDWAARKIAPADRAYDGEFVRRVYLDLVGRSPRVAETRAFLADAAPNKRAKLVERLMSTPGFAVHFASLTRAEWLPQSLSNPQLVFLGNQFEDWLRRKYSSNVPLDKVVRDLLIAKVQVGQRGQVAFDQNADPDTVSISAFYQSNEVKPEQIAATSSRAFLGVKLECAQCHDHPFAKYTRDQFWQFAAFFGEFTPLPPTSPSFVGPKLPQHDTNRLTIPNTTRTITARYFNGESPDWSADRSPRQELALWLTDGQNDYFARNLANRLWAQVFGIGITDPVDEPGDENPPSHPALLDDLAAGLVESGFDQQVLLKAMLASRAYNLTSRVSDPSQNDARRFARMNLKGLTSNQIYDSFIAATGHRDGIPRAQQQFFDPRNENGRSAFRNLFTLGGKPTETQTSILQALMMMNGGLTANQTSLDKSDVLAAVIDAPFLDNGKRIDTLFLAAFTREPTAEEREKYTSYVDRGGPSGDKKKALADVFWVLLNSPEFLFNH